LRITVPGNLLLLGEYAVLEEGGLGITLAVDRSVSIHVESSNTLTISGTDGSRQFSWPREGQNELFRNIVSECRKFLEGRGLDLPQVAIAADSHNLYTFNDMSNGMSNSRKLGLGSSAAVTVGISAALLLQEISWSPDELRSQVFEIALRAHRKAQGGRGSGYDIAASTFGGIGLFRGGKKPDYRNIPLPWLSSFFLFKGGEGVVTTGAIARYNRWRERSNWRGFVESSNRCIENLLKAEDFSHALTYLKEGRDLGISLGTVIGVPGEMTDLPESRFSKALGAGNEIALLFPDNEDLSPPPEGCIPVTVREEGIQWEE
jgi:phosphomevalonate kinase